MPWATRYEERRSSTPASGTLITRCVRPQANDQPNAERDKETQGDDEDEKSDVFGHRDEEMLRRSLILFARLPTLAAIQVQAKFFERMATPRREE